MNPDQQSQATEGPQQTPIASDRPPVPLLAWLYLALALAGAIFPWLANIDFIQTYGSGFDLGQFIALANANPAAQSLSRDLAVSATAVTIWLVIESRRLTMRGLPWVLLSCIAINFAFGASLFLHLRERRLAELQHQSTIVGSDAPVALAARAEL
jgi:hypothetical protein